jgi:uncharacterized membrane protein
MSKQLLKALPELVEADVITEETAEKIKTYYLSRPDNSANRLYVVFGFLGAVLVGLGIVLIIAHNWDDLSKPVKVFFAFLPVLTAQGLCGYTLLKKPENQAWRESCATLLFLALPAGISMISQIYQISGNMSNFLLTWMLLGLPLIYLMRSSLVSLLYLAGITWYASEVGYWQYPASDPVWYLLMLALVLPYYYMLFKKNRRSNSFAWHSLFIPLSLSIGLASFLDTTYTYIVLIYIAWFSVLHLTGSLMIYQSLSWRFNPLWVLGTIGSLVLLYGLSFPFFWTDLANHSSETFILSKSLYFLMALVITGIVLLIFTIRRQGVLGIQPVEILFLAGTVIYITGVYAPDTAMWLINLFMLWIGIAKILEGTRTNAIGIMNYGFLMIAILIICRFFDESLSFILKGLIFILLGAGFFVANYQMIRKRKNTSSQ